jgi:hypothetical protein
VSHKLRRRVRQRKGRIERRLARAQAQGCSAVASTVARVEVGARTVATSWGGIVAAHKVALSSGLVELIDSEFQLFKQPGRYKESDHVLNLAFNALCGGRCLEDIELRRQDEAYLDALGATSIPDPTTAGDFCRRFDGHDVDRLQDLINHARVLVWQQQPKAFLNTTARLDVDASIVATGGECKQGMALSYNGIWGYSALLVSLANTGEPLLFKLHGANRPSHEGAPSALARAISVVRTAGFKDVLLRGDTAFSLTAHFDAWTSDRVRFVFGYNASQGMKSRADAVPDDEYRELVRQATQCFKRRKQPRVKEQVVRLKEYKNLKLRREDVAEFQHQPGKSKRPYRMVVLRKNISVEKGDHALFDDIRYFFYITNDPDMDALQVVIEANKRCNQENLIRELKGGVRALHAPVNCLVSNWAYLVMTALAWTLKAWMALSLPVSARWRAKHDKHRRRWLRMGFRAFVNAVIRIPAQVLTTGRRRVVRMLAWTPELHTTLRLLDAW